MIQVIWTVAFMTLHGAIVRDIQDTEKRFADAESCELYAKHSWQRVEQLSRSVFYVPSNEPIHVLWRCDVVGDPA